MNEHPVGRHDAVRAALGAPGRMISFSKSRYVAQHPDNVCIFNGNVCFEDGKAWWGDLNLTLEETGLQTLAAAAGETVYLIYERDGRFEHEHSPRLDRPVYSVTASGHTRYDYTFIVRDSEGSLRRRPPPPDTRRRLALTFGRPGLLRVRTRECEQRSFDGPDGPETSTLLYIGERLVPQPRRSPLLILGRFRRPSPRAWHGYEISWYPTRKRHAHRPLVSLHLSRKRGTVRPYLTLVAHPGLEYRLLVGVERRCPPA